jgi:arylsulfatase
MFVQALRPEEVLLLTGEGEGTQLDRSRCEYPASMTEPAFISVFSRLVWLLAALFTLSAVAQQPAASPPPNLIVILADDMGYGDLGCYGGKNPTPNLDAMAKEGLRFTSFCVPHGACTPSRAALLTGCYANRIGLPDVLFPASRIGLDASEETLATLCKKAGYATAALGKWHLGDAPEFLPTRRGFDAYWGIPYSNDMWPVNYQGNPEPKKNYPPLPIIEGAQQVGTIQTLADQATLTSTITKRAVQFIQESAKQPFFLYVAHPMPHCPIAAGPEFVGKSGRGLYGDVMMELDWSVGEILKAVDGAGVRERTLVVFLSDNGPWLNFGDHAGSAGILREGKGTEWEGGVRVPCIMRMPGTLPAGAVYAHLASSLDLLPTFAAMAGLTMPTRPIDGVDFSKVLRGSLDAQPRQEFYYYYSTALEAVRRGKWKLHVPHEFRCYEGSTPGRGGFPGPIGTGRTSFELFDLEADPQERRNVADLNLQVVEDLKKLAATARADLGDGKARGSGQRDPGHVTTPSK